MNNLKILLRPGNSDESLGGSENTSRGDSSKENTSKEIMFLLVIFRGFLYSVGPPIDTRQEWLQKEMRL